MPTESLVIDGSTINRTSANITITRMTPHIRGGIPEFHFARRGIALASPPDPYVTKSITYTLDGTLYFSGDVVDFYDHYDTHLGWVREYTCLGLLQRAQYIPVTDSLTSTDTCRYNVAPDDPAVVPARQGRSIGQIVADVLTMTANATAFNAAGIGAYTSMSPPTLPSATTTDLAALTVVPAYEVDVSGERILQALEGVIQSCHPNHYVHVQPDGTIRVLDPRAFTARTLQIGVEPRVGMPEYRRDTRGNYTRVLVRGNTLVRAQLLQTKPWPGSSNSDGGLQEDFAHDGLTNAQAKALWKSTDFQNPGGQWGQATASANIVGGAVASAPMVQNGYGYSTAPGVHVTGNGTGASYTANISGGSVTSLTKVSGGSGYTNAVVLIDPPGGSTFDIGSCTCPSTTTVTVTSAITGQNWGANHWDQTSGNAQGVIMLYADVITGVTQTWQARVTANTALSVGGTSTLTIDNPLPSLNYTAYELIGVGTGASVVWRKYKVTDTATGSSLANYFPYPVAYRSPNGGAATMTTAITGDVMLSIDGSGNRPYYERPEPITVDPTSGHIYFTKPTALVYSIDGQTAVPPDNVQVFVAVQNGTLSTVYPPDSGGSPVYGGTAYTVEGIQRTKTITVNDWRDYSNNAAMATFAQEMFDALSNTVIEGTLPVYNYDPQWFTPGLSLNVAAAYTTGLESANVPVVQADWIPDESGQEGSIGTVMLHFSNRRAPYSASALMHPSQTGISGLNLWSGSVDLSGFTGSYANAAGAAINQVGAQAQAAISPDMSSLPRGMADLGIPQSTADLGIPASTADYGVDLGGQESAVSSMLDYPSDAAPPAKPSGFVNAPVKE